VIRKNINIIGLIILSVLVSGCFEEEKPKKVKKREATNYLAKKVPVDTNKSLSKVVEDDGIVIDGSRDEQLLDAFGLAVSQVIVEEGVSVPDCSALAKTGYLTQEDCKEISDKYFGFYEIDMITGEAKKVDDVFKAGVSGAEINIRDSEAELFDSSGNPLLNNIVEFEEVVDNSNDSNFLRELSAKIPKENQEMQKIVDERLSFLEDLKESQKEQERVITPKIQREQESDIEKVNNITDEETNDQAINSQEYREAKSNLSSALSRVSSLELQFERVEIGLQQDPTDEDLILQYNNLNLQLANAQAEVSYYQSLLQSMESQ
jgi:hypothetical protein